MAVKIGTVILAVSLPDTQAECEQRGLLFDQVVWLLDLAYAPNMNLEQYEIVKTVAYQLKEGENHG